MGNIASMVFPSADKPEVRHFCMICNDQIEIEGIHRIVKLEHCEGHTSYACHECERKLIEYKRRHSANKDKLVKRIQQMREKQKHNKKTAVGLEAHANRGRTQLLRRSTRLRLRTQQVKITIINA